jgi:hypothetical protein
MTTSQTPKDTKEWIRIQMNVPNPLRLNWLTANDVREVRQQEGLLRRRFRFFEATRLAYGIKINALDPLHARAASMRNRMRNGI